MICQVAHEFQAEISMNSLFEQGENDAAWSLLSSLSSSGVSGDTVEIQWRYIWETGDWRVWGMMLRDRQPSQWRASIVRFRVSYFGKAA
jgi:hypothetical protein